MSTTELTSSLPFIPPQNPDENLSGQVAQNLIQCINVRNSINHAYLQ